jgi:hypothetical protein
MNVVQTRRYSYEVLFRIYSYSIRIYIHTYSSIHILYIFYSDRNLRRKDIWIYNGFGYLS